MKTVISAIQQKGGSGKTTLLVSLAGELSKLGSVVMIDADPQQSAFDWLEGFDGFPVVSTDKPIEAIAKAAADFVIVDTPSHNARVAAKVFPISDLVLIPVMPSPLDIRAAIPLLRNIADGKSKVPAVVVLCRTDSRTKATKKARTVIEGLGVSVAASELGSRIAHAEASVAGVPVSTYGPSGAAAAEAKDLTREILKILKGANR